MATPLSVKGIFECRPVLVSLAILKLWVKVINEVIVRVVQPVVKKAWTVVHAFLWWQHQNCKQLELDLATIQEELQAYDNNNIYNMDQTVLYWKTSLDCTIVTEQMAGGKAVKACFCEDLMLEDVKTPQQPFNQPKRVKQAQ